MCLPCMLYDNNADASVRICTLKEDARCLMPVVIANLLFVINTDGACYFADLR